MVQPLLLQYYQLLPEHHSEEEPADWPRQFRKALAKFKRSVEARYTEATLERLLYSHDLEAREASLLALGLTGSIKVNATIAARLHDEDPVARQLASDAGMGDLATAPTLPENVLELQRLVQLVASEGKPEEVEAGFDALIRKSAALCRGV